MNFLLQALKVAGHRALVVAPNYGYGHKVKGVEVFRVKSLYLRPRRVSLPIQSIDAGPLREVMDYFQPDLIHSHHPFLLGKAALDLADELAVPLVYTFHTLYEFFTHYLMVDTDAVRKMVREYVIRYANRCDQVIVPTEPIREYLVSVGVKVPTATVPTGIDFSRFKNVPPERVEEMRRAYGLERFDRILLYVGRLSKEKNVPLAVQALAELTARGRNYALLIFGEGPEENEIERLAEKLRLGSRVILGGFLDQETLAAAYFLGDVFLFPSQADTQGIVLYEARATGLPIVAADSLAARAAIQPEKNGLLALAEPQDFAAKIEEILADRERFSQPLDIEVFSVETISQLYDRLYREVTARGRTPDREASRRLSRLIEEIVSLMD